MPWLVVPPVTQEAIWRDWCDGMPGPYSTHMAHTCFVLMRTCIDWENAFEGTNGGGKLTITSE